MLPYQPNSESCLIGCYNTEEVEPNNFPRQVANFSATTLCPVSAVLICTSFMAFLNSILVTFACTLIWCNLCLIMDLKIYK